MESNKELTLEKMIETLQSNEVYNKTLIDTVKSLFNKNESEKNRQEYLDKLDEHFETFKKAQKIYEDNIHNLLTDYRKKYRYQLFDAAQAKDFILLKYNNGVKMFEQQLKLDKKNHKTTYNVLLDFGVEKDEPISVLNRVTDSLAKRSNGTDGIPDYRILVVDGKAEAIIKNDGFPMPTSSAINVPYNVNNITKTVVLKPKQFLAECNKNMSIVPNENRISESDLSKEQLETLNELRAKLAVKPSK